MRGDARTDTAALTLGALTLLACSGVARAAELPARVVTNAGNSALTQVRYYRKKRPLEVAIYGRRRIGGYAYRSSMSSVRTANLPRLAPT